MKAKEIHYMDAIHFRPREDNGNVRCLNGSAHIKRTTDIKHVTCKACLDKNTHKSFWDLKEYESSMNWVQKRDYYGF